MQEISRKGFGNVLNCITGDSLSHTPACSSIFSQAVHPTAGVQLEYDFAPTQR